LDDEEEPELVRNVHVLNQPFVMSVFTSIILATLVLPNLPPLLGYVFAFIAVICVVSILTMMMRGGIKWLGYTLAALYVALEVSDFLSVGDAEARWLTLAISVGTLITTIWIWQRRESIRSESMNQSWSRLMIVLSIPMAVVSVLAIVANVLGYGSIAAFLNHGAVLVLIIGLLLLSVFKSLMSVVYHGFHTTFAHNSFIIKEDGDALFRWLTNILRLVTLGIYIYYCLSFFLLWEPVYDILQSVWSFGYAFGSVMLTVGDVVNVILIIIAFWVVASILRILLRKEVFNRVHAPRGVGNAVASMTHYTIMVIGVFLALASAGFETRHLGILAGALGVGIGFGLQTIVNNFLSGLILVFERPVTVDDVVEVDGILGTVTAIGIRSSKIRQFNGDEVIVPNADLISKRVTNRTLSDTRRRYTMTFETGRADDPEKVMKIITSAAQGVDGVLEDPPVKAYFKGMGAQSIKFYVNYWGSGNFLDLMSDVEMTVYKALEEARVQMPIPVQIEIQKDD
jgi:small-conductance mechanosensitive channel